MAQEKSLQARQARAALEAAHAQRRPDLRAARPTLDAPDTSTQKEALAAATTAAATGATGAALPPAGDAVSAAVASAVATHGGGLAPSGTGNGDRSAARADASGMPADTVAAPPGSRTGTDSVAAAGSDIADSPRHSRVDRAVHGGDGTGSARRDAATSTVTRAGARLDATTADAGATAPRADAGASPADRAPGQAVRTGRGAADTTDAADPASGAGLTQGIDARGPLAIGNDTAAARADARSAVARQTVGPRDDLGTDSAAARANRQHDRIGTTANTTAVTTAGTTAGTTTGTPLPAWLAAVTAQVVPDSAAGSAASADAGPSTLALAAARSDALRADPARAAFQEPAAVQPPRDSAERPPRDPAERSPRDSTARPPGDAAQRPRDATAPPGVAPPFSDAWPGRSGNAPATAAQRSGAANTSSFDQAIAARDATAPPGVAPPFSDAWPGRSGNAHATAAARAGGDRRDMLLTAAAQRPGAANTSSFDQAIATAAASAGRDIGAGYAGGRAVGADALQVPAGWLAAGPTQQAEHPAGVDAAASLTVATPLDSPEFAQTLGLQVSLLARDGVQHAELHMNPKELGPVSVRITLDGSEARVDFAADAAATRQAIEASLPALASALLDAGLTLSGGGVTQHPGQRQDQPPPRNDRNDRGDVLPGRRRDEAIAGSSPIAQALPPAAARRSGSVSGVDLYA